MSALSDLSIRFPAVAVFCVSLTLPGCQQNSEAINRLQARGVTVSRNLRDEVSSVQFGNTAMTDADVAAIVALKEMTELTGNASQLSAKGLQQLSQLPSLEILHLHELSEPENLAGVLAQLTSLKELDLSGAKGSLTECLSAIAGLTNIESLSLNQTGLSDSDAELLCGLKSTAFRILRADDTQLSNHGIQRIAESHSRLTQISLNRCPVTTAGIEALNKLTELTHLSLRQCQLTDTDLANIGRIMSLRVLDVGDNPELSDAAVLSLGALPDLLSLDVSKSALTGIGFNKAGFSSLATLTANGTQVTDAAIPDLELPTLYSLHLRNTSVSESAIRKVFPANHQTAVAF